MRSGWIVLGFVLLVIGGASLLLEGISYTSEEEVAEFGPLEVTAERQERLNLPPWLAFTLLGAGGVAILAGLQSGRREG